jgi:hypothetical protein
MKLIFPCLVLWLISLPLKAQNASLYQIHPSTLFATTEEPKPYNLEKKRSAGYFTARFAIITGGSFAITMGLSTAIISPLTPSWSIDRQVKTALISATSVSAGIALSDLIIGLVLKKRADRRQQELREQLL